MIPDEIQSDRLMLFRTSSEQLRALVAVGGGFDFIMEPGWLEDPADLEESVRHCDESTWWLPFLIRLRDDSRVIGVCLLKGPPDEKGLVEIAYSIAPTWRCQGYAREAVAAFTRETCRVPEVTSITDVEIGPLWKWRYGGE
jgi:RimJ/RimL family protein N-acetyltransferase